MDVFGETWADHAMRIREHWQREIHEDDVVLVPGDISWAMREAEVLPDLAFLSSLPGSKVLLRGNHDYWWSTRAKVERWAGPSCYILQNNAIAIAGCAFVGSRGWVHPQTDAENSQDALIYLREVERLRLSLEAGRQTGLPLIALTHFPPLLDPLERTPVTTLLEAYGVRLCVYGHLHGNAHKTAVQGNVNGVRYVLTAADYLQFCPLSLEI